MDREYLNIAIDDLAEEKALDRAEHETSEEAKRVSDEQVAKLKAFLSERLGDAVKVRPLVGIPLGRVEHASLGAGDVVAVVRGFLSPDGGNRYQSNFGYGIEKAEAITVSFKFRPEGSTARPQNLETIDEEYYGPYYFLTESSEGEFRPTRFGSAEHEQETMETRAKNLDDTIKLLDEVIQLA